MAYIFTLLAVAGLAIKGYSGKRTSACMRRTGDAYLFNLIRLILCMLIGLLLVFAEQAHTQLAVDGGMLAICALSGLSNVGFLVGWMLAIQRNSLVTVDVALTVGSILPAVLCLLLFNEPLSGSKLIGFGLLLVAVVLLSGYNRQTKGKIGVMGIVLVVIAAVSDGLSSFSQQLYKHFYTEDGVYAGSVLYPKTIYHFYCYVFAALALLVFWIVYFIKHRSDFPQDGRTVVRDIGEGLKKPLPHIVVMAVCLFVSNYCQTVATGDYGMSPQILYPFLKGGCLVLMNVIAMVFFGEKATRTSVIGSLVALIGIIMMNLL